MSDPRRRLEWDGYFHGSIEERSDGVLVAKARKVRPDGKPVKVRPQFRVTEFVVSRYLPGQCIEWESSWPAKPGAVTASGLRSTFGPTAPARR
ncbi:hypothetical protein [Arthrobacter sp. ATA002]|uniref:hypothetical protein n=1 Tax=Arthrobacter sp. ATA002 TaxID=2991715 RepID=UPI003FA4673E